MVSRRDFLSNAAALATTGLLSAGHEAPAQMAAKEGPAERPNILIFMPDQQQGATVLPDHPCLTPNIDQFAKDGLLFSNAFCPAPHCCPSRASFQTGLYPSEHGVFNNVDTDTAIHYDPYPGIRYFSQSLDEAGYELGYSGKWHVGHTLRPHDVSWTELAPTGSASIADLRADHRSKFWATAQQQYQHPTPRSPGQVKRPGWMDQTLYAARPAGYENLRDYAVVKEGIAGIQQFAGGTKPWCVMVSNDGGHDLYDPPQNYLDLYDWRKIKLPENFRDTMDDKPRVYQRMRYQYWQQLTDDEVKQCIAHYYALLTMQDALFGLLLETLDKTGQKDNTLVIYCSDHGDYAGAHGLWAKGVPSFREAYNIPCVLRWPNGIRAPGRQVDALVSTTDFAPTILEVAGIKAPPPMSGTSLVPWLRNERPESWRDAVFSQLNGVELYYTQRIIQTKDFKYVYNGFDYDELYDLRNDPHETRNLAFPDLAAARASTLRGMGRATTDRSVWPPLPETLDSVRRDLLIKMWRFAQRHNDQIFNNYLTVAFAPYGPGIAL
jgi:arylsulfatase A-like enzyme